MDVYVQSRIAETIGARTAAQTLWVSVQTIELEVECPECEGIFLLEMDVTSDECAEAECPECTHLIMQSI